MTLGPLQTPPCSSLLLLAQCVGDGLQDRLLRPALLCSQGSWCVARETCSPHVRDGEGGQVRRLWKQRPA